MEPNLLAIVRAFSSMYQGEINRYLSKHKSTKRDGSYPFIPFNVDSFVKLIQVAEQVSQFQPATFRCRPGFKVPSHYEMTGQSSETKPLIIEDPNAPENGSYSGAKKRFLDAGCGPGFTVKLAAGLGYEAEGIEIDPVHITNGREMGVTIHEGDMTTWDCRPYSVVYSYVPIHGKPWEDFTARVSREAKVGAVFASATYWRLPDGETEKYESVFKGNGVVIKKIAE